MSKAAGGRGNVYLFVPNIIGYFRIIFAFVSYYYAYSNWQLMVFFYLLFAVFFPEWGLNWLQLGVGDYGVKALMALSLLAPYRMLMGFFAPQLLARRSA